MPDLVKSKADPRQAITLISTCLSDKCAKKTPPKTKNQLSVLMATVGPHLQGVLD